jgi:hypothetical protein
MTHEETAELVKRLRSLARQIANDPVTTPDGKLLTEQDCMYWHAAEAIKSLCSSLDSRDTTIDKLESERACLIQELEHSQKRVADMLIQLGDLQQRHLTMIRELAKEKA